MKTIKAVFCLALVCMVAFYSCSSSRSSQNQREEKTRVAREIQKIIDNRDFKIDVDQMIPVGAPSRVLTSAYSLEIKNDTVNSYLPYFGRAYNVAYGGGEGLNFKAPIIYYTSGYKKKVFEIRFTTRSNDDTFTYNISIHPNGNANISVNSNNRQAISYNGSLAVSY